MKVTGRGGVDLHARWAGDPRAYLGITIPEFPNLFCLYGPNTNLVVNGSLFLFSECAVNYTLECLRSLLRDGGRAMDLRPEILEAYDERIEAANTRMAWGVPGVTNWYKNERRQGDAELAAFDARVLGRGTRRPEEDHYEIPLNRVE